MPSPSPASSLQMGNRHRFYPSPSSAKAGKDEGVLVQAESRWPASSPLNSYVSVMKSDENNSPDYWSLNLKPELKNLKNYLTQVHQMSGDLCWCWNFPKWIFPGMLFLFSVQRASLCTRLFPGTGKSSFCRVFRWMIFELGSQKHVIYLYLIIWHLSLSLSSICLSIGLSSICQCWHVILLLIKWHQLCAWPKCKFIFVPCVFVSMSLIWTASVLTESRPVHIFSSACVQDQWLTDFQGECRCLGRLRVLSAIKRESWWDWAIDTSGSSWLTLALW